MNSGNESGGPHALDASWDTATRVGHPGVLHGDPPRPDRRRLVRCIPDRSAVVLGSTTPDFTEAAARSRHGIVVVRRRSGGGAVWVTPDEPLWVDVCLPRHDPWWHDDVTVAAMWVGEWWVRALAPVIGPSAGRLEVCPAATRPGDGAGRLVCFAGLGPGEVTLDGAKLVGVSQRRTSVGAVFQCAVYSRPDPSWLRRVAMGSPDLDAAARALATVRGTGVDHAEVWDALVASAT